MGSDKCREVDLAVSPEDQYFISDQKVRDGEKKFKIITKIYQSENYKVSFARLLYSLADLNFPQVN